MTNVFNDKFYEGFESLQRYSNEKQVYVDTFIDYINRYSACSLLDIGAGNGDLAIPVSDHVEKYVAVERSPEYADLLRSAGKTVIQRLFPTEIEGQYDLVVMSHVVSHVMGNYTSLVPSAWELVKPEGHLLIVTNQDTEEGDWSRLLEAVGLGYPDLANERLQELIHDLQQIGNIEIRRVSSYLTTQNVTQMVEAMAFLAASGGTTHRDRFMKQANVVARILDSGYRSGDGYHFPLTHPFISTQKPGI